MKRLRMHDDIVYTDICMIDPDTDVIILASLFCRAGNTMKAVTSRMKLSYRGKLLEMNTDRGKVFDCSDEYQVFYQGYKHNKDQVVHSLVVNEAFGSKGRYLLLPTIALLEDRFFNKLLLQYDYPILEEWIPYILEKCYEKGYVKCITENLYVTKHLQFKIGNEQYRTEEMQIFRCDLTDNKLKKIIQEGLKSYQICISPNQQDKLEFASLNEYIEKYGHTIVDSLRETIQPLCETKGEVEGIILKSKTPYPQQAALVNGLDALFKIASYGIMNEGMGCGKTLQGAAICEKYSIGKYLVKNGGTSVDAVENVKYRHIVMCPSHLVEKWVEEILDVIPLAKVTIIEKLSQLIYLNKKGKKRTEKEYFIISKDFCKLSYLQKPTPTVVSSRLIKYSHCIECYCQHTYNDFLKGKACVECGNKLVENNRGYETGLICPSCGEVLFPSRGNINYESDDFEDKYMPMQPHDFSSHKSSNSTCTNCGDSLWQPFTKNLSKSTRIKRKKDKWVRITHYKNKNKKSKITSWVHSQYMTEYLDRNNVEEYEYARTNAFRKYAPSWYIKKYLKGFFDIAIFDECHDLKGTTAQGHAMHALIKSSKKHLPLTGTIAGGYAHHLFYLLYRLCPGKMKKLGYEFSDVKAFSKDYGVVEDVYAYSNEQEAYNNSSRGKKVNSTPKVRPGINPLIVPRFLLENTVFLDISELSAFLPALVEKVILVDMQDNLAMYYNRFISKFKALAKRNFGMFSILLQYGLSYVDKPYRMDNVYDPKGGHLLHQFSDLGEDTIWPKEKALLDLVSKEINEERNCFIYMEFTGDGDKNVCDRIKKLIEDNCNLNGKVAYMRSNAPGARKRQSWIRKMASKGIKVFITNYRCTQTGLDFIFNYEGVLYNYPTIIFYQLGTNMFAIWQAACRHYRLSQVKECRTYYVAYKDTLQEKILHLIADKKVATAAIQGNFSAEGLAAMANGVDLRVKLAQTLESDYKQKYSVEEMFDKVNAAAHTRELSEQELAFLERMKAKEDVIIQDDSSVLDYVMDEEDIVVIDFDDLRVVEETKSKKIIKGQLTFF